MGKLFFSCFFFLNLLSKLLDRLIFFVDAVFLCFFFFNYLTMICFVVLVITDLVLCVCICSFFFSFGLPFCLLLQHLIYCFAYSIECETHIVAKADQIFFFFRIYHFNGSFILITIAIL